MLFRIDYEYGRAKLYTPYNEWEERFYELAEQCLGIRKSIGELTLLSKSIESPKDKIPGEFERLEHNGDVIIWNAQGEKIKSEFED